MIVPGEASESDDDGVVADEDAEEAEEEVAAEVINLAVLPPHRLGGGASLASQFSSTLQAVTKQLGNLSSSRQQSSLSDAGSSSSSSPRSLLHEKLFEKNRALKGDADRFVEEHVARVPRELAALLGSYSKTQVFIQDSVLSMQQANHFCAETLESMDDFLEIGGRIKFPE
jgi:hypothetical protein